jgi:quercetin 2,3-dioxygenase
MIHVVKSSERHFADHGWLQTYWHFSFAEYRDPKNMHWSVLRVFNDDIIQPGGGFGMHPHRDMEIVTWVIAGQLEHRDHLGNRGLIHPGEVQVMSAGTGITHSEYNPSDKSPVHLLQMWLLPRMASNKPRWEQRRFSADERSGRLLPVVSAGDVPQTLTIDQDATIYVSSLPADKSVTHDSQRGRYAYLFMIEGEASLNGEKLATGDQARIKDEKRLEVIATKPAELILLDLPG